MKKILLIGAGPTSSLLAYNLKQLENKFAFELHIWEKSRGIGGRFATSRSPFSQDCFADLGAQHLTHNKANTWASPYFDTLKQNALIAKIPTENIGGFRNAGKESNEEYVCPKGTASVVKFFLQEGKTTTIQFNKRVTQLDLDDSGAILVSSSSDDDTETEVFDAVISTMPPPQILQLQGINQLLTKTGQAHLVQLLKEVEYSSRYALGMFYKNSVDLDSSEKALNYVENDPMLRFWSFENAKRHVAHSATDACPPSAAFVVHTSVPFAIQNLERDLKEMEPVLLEHSKQKIKSIKHVQPDHVKCHRWRYSQVSKSFPGSPGFVELSTGPLILAAGDGFTSSGIQGCIISAEKSFARIQSWLADNSKSQ